MLDAGGQFGVAAPGADAVGFASPTAPGSETVAGSLDDKRMWDTLRTCYDPEIPVNIVDLGLVYDLQLAKLPNGNCRVDVKMTLTAPGCGMGPAIAGDAQVKLLSLPGVDDAQVEIVWEPPWHHSMITPAGKKVLGLE